MDRCELAWVAGFFDGEGWANAVRSAGRRTSQPQARVNQADAAGVPAVLLRMQTALGGLGRIAGPQRLEGRVDLYRWEVSSRGDVQHLHDLIAPWLGQVKLDQLAAALQRPALQSGAVDGTDEWAAWAAGVFDGEGSSYLVEHRTHVGYRNSEARVTQGSPADVPEMLLRFHTVVGTGRIYGPYRQRDANLLVYRWNTSARKGVETMLARIWTWLGETKRSQAAAVLATVRAQPSLSRGRIEWGSHKERCVHGHDYSAARLRPYASRGVGIKPRDSSQCLQCAREQARLRRASQKGPMATDDRRSILEESAAYYLLK